MLGLAYTYYHIMQLQFTIQVTRDMNFEHKHSANP